ncbi:MAG: hypothetical protein ABW250_06545 [Pyrinomonadaceae bacterium]
MRTPPLILLLLISLVWGLQPRGTGAGQKEAGATSAPASDGLIKVTIALGGGMYGPVKDRFKVGEEIPVVISMTNTGDKPAQYCLSTTIIQNRPQLERDGETIPYLTHLLKLVDTETATERCENSAFRQLYWLQPKQQKSVDWITFGQRGVLWYEPLPPGRYELVLMRRVECCRGPLLKSNKVVFDVVP